MVSQVYFIARYAVVGIVGGITQLFFDYLFIEVFNVWYMYGVVVGFLVALLITFTLHRHWTFRIPDSPDKQRQFMFYTGTAVFSLIGNVGLMYYFVEELLLWYVTAQIFTVGIVAGLSFLFNTFITFRYRFRTNI